MRSPIIFFASLALISTATGCATIDKMPQLPWSSSGLENDRTAEALYADGIRYFNDKRYTRALDAFSKIKTDFPFSPLLTDAELKIADAYYLNQQYPEAITAFKEFQSLHPNNENIPFVIFRLGQSHFDQFTTTDREQKNTEAAKGYFETVINNYPKSPYAPQAREKLAKCIEYLSEYEYNLAYYYFQHEKFPAARDRFEEIVRKYKGTPAAEKSLFYLGESYRKEKNYARASLAYEALVQHYPEGKFTKEARLQLTQLDKERQDPLAMLLMRDRRPGPAITEPTTDVAKTNDIPNLVAKTDVVYEEPGEEKGFFSRVADKINPFSSSSDAPKATTPAASTTTPAGTKPESALDVLAKRQAAQKAAAQEPGFFSRLFGSSTKEPAKKVSDGSSTTLVASIDNSLQEKGVDSKTQTSLNSSPDEFAKVAEKPQPRPNNTAELLGSVDANLRKSGANLTELPPPPEAAEVFRDPNAAKAVIAKTAPPSPEAKSAAVNSLLGSIDQKLKTQGVDAPKFEAPPDPKQNPYKPEAPQKVELEPKIALEKGPLFLSPVELSTQARPTQAPDEPKTPAVSKTTAEDKNPETPNREFARSLVKGPVQPQAQPKIATTTRDDENKNTFEQLKQDLDSIGKALNPFGW